MSLGSPTERVDSPLTKINIRQYKRETGIFFPDSYSLLPRWCRGDPFSSSRSSDDTSRLYTEKLPGANSETLQSFLVLLPSNTRGNIGIAEKNTKPDWLSYEEYQMFATLRAFPHIQLRHLLVAMTDDLLPFGDERVHVLIRQLLYHVGMKSWKRDLESELFYNQFAKLLERKADMLEESPNNLRQLLLFGVASSFLGQYSEHCLSCSRRYTAMSRALGDLVDSEVRNSEKISPKRYWKQAQLYGYALLSHSPRDRCELSLLQLVELIVLFHCKVLFAAEYLSKSKLHHALHLALARNISALLKAVEANLWHLTKCLGLIIDDLPSELTWTNVCYPEASRTACFEAQADHHYSINILNGILLVDGVPPGFLPSSVVRNPLFVRTFKSRNFECIVLGMDHYRTSRLIDNRFHYEFVYEKDRLTIIEHDAESKSWSAQNSSSQRLLVPKKQQISDPPRQGIAFHHAGLVLVPREKFDLPTLLTEPYSHWYSSRHNAFLIRAPFYKERAVVFIATQEAVYKVPGDDTSLSLDVICGKLESYDRLLFLPPRRICSLGRIEEHHFILPWVDANFEHIRYSMPRLGLEFIQKEHVVRSENFSRFVLSSQQTLEGTLPGVATYVILVDELGIEKVLIPDGVVSECGNVRRVLDWNYEGSCHVYDVHPRFRHLCAKDTAGRLQLACMYAATSCLIAERRSKQTGAGIAIELVRHCFTNQQLSGIEKEKLIEVSQLSKLSCTLRLMCTWIWDCACRLGFLRDDSDSGDVPPAEPSLELDPLALREYRQTRHGPRLSPTEESTLLGSRQYQLNSPRMLSPPTETDTQRYVARIEEMLREKCLVSVGGKRETTPFPLDVADNASEVEQSFYRDLVSSWDDHLALPTSKVGQNRRYCLEVLKEVGEKREGVESMLLASLNIHQSKEFSISVLSGRTRLASPRDLLLLVLDVNVFAEINPFLFLPDYARVQLRKKIVDWMMLCVLEDKLGRILASSSDNEVLEELRATRTWNPLEHLRWLVFEVEQQLQIRPYQYAVVNQLLENPHSTVQLNMGLGKTVRSERRKFSMPEHY
jgi:Protein of unknown function (DUF3638)